MSQKRSRRLIYIKMLNNDCSDENTLIFAVCLR